MKKIIYVFIIFVSCFALKDVSASVTVTGNHYPVPDELEVSLNYVRSELSTLWYQRKHYKYYFVSVDSTCVNSGGHCYHFVFTNSKPNNWTDSYENLGYSSFSKLDAYYIRLYFGKDGFFRVDTTTYLINETLTFSGNVFTNYFDSSSSSSSSVKVDDFVPYFFMMIIPILLIFLAMMFRRR